MGVFTTQSAILAIIVLIILLIFVSSWRYFFTTGNDPYRSRSYRCSNCDKFNRTGSLFEGYCYIWKREVLKDSTCKHFNAKGLIAKLMGKLGF